MTGIGEMGKMLMGADPVKKTCVTPVVVSKVFSVKESWQGTFGVNVSETTVRINPRGEVRPLEENGRLTSVTAPAARVNVVAVPIVAPEELMNETDPVQDAAFAELPVELEADGFVAVLIRLTPIVSVLASPTSGKEYWEVFVLVVDCPNANPALRMAKLKRTLLGMTFPLRCLGISRARRLHFRTLTS